MHAIKRAYPLAWVLVLFLVVSASAHQPRFPAGHEGEDRDHALAVADITLSQVFYQPLTPEAPRFWLQFEAERGEPLFLQLGLPVLQRQVDFRPALALLGPGLPPVDLPFELPAGAGGLVLRAPDKPLERFHEPFSDTDSWILVEQTIALPEAGRYHVVAYHPDGETGKLWVALGKREAFGPDALTQMPGWLSEARRFHEVDGGPGWLNAVWIALGALAAATMAWVILR